MEESPDQFRLSFFYMLNHIPEPCHKMNMYRKEMQKRYLGTLMGSEIRMNINPMGELPCEHTMLKQCWLNVELVDIILNQLNCSLSCPLSYLTIAD